MVLFIDFAEDSKVVELPTSTSHWSQQTVNASKTSNVQVLEDCQRENPNRNALTEALGCYPVIMAVASSIDLNTLDNLSRTCRQVRANLLQFRKQLLMHTLHCNNEDVVPNPEHTLRYRASAADWYFVERGGANVVGKTGSCARDMVAECRRCKDVICRNCAIKSPAPVLLNHRHRRLCPTCIRAPLSKLIAPHLSTSSPCTTAALIAEFCDCATIVWLCRPCGRGLRTADNTYSSIWSWRARYGPALGGLGTGIGEGNRSFACGREGACLAARTVEEEIDCDAEDARDSLNSFGALSVSPTPSSGSGSSVQLGPGYARHEIEGIGGVVKTKLVRMVKVGACVTEWEDEREQGKYLVREMEGRARSWCGWCWRVIPATGEEIEPLCGK